MKKVCPHCGVEKESRGFHIHEKACVEKNQPEEPIPDKFSKLRVRYEKQLRTMTPEQGEKFLRKAQGG